MRNMLFVYIPRVWLAGRGVLVLAGGTVEGPVARRDTRVINDGDGTIEDVQREAFHPAVPVTLVELVAGVGVAEEAGALTHLWPQRVIEVPPPARPEPLQLVPPPC